MIASQPKPEIQAQNLIAVVRALVEELHPQRAKLIDVTESSRLQQDLGIDSLGRMELILRIERAFQRRLPVNVMGEADTIRDILVVLEQAPTVSASPAPSITELTRLPAIAAATEARMLVDVLDWHLAQHPDRQHLTLLQDDRVVLATLTYRELSEAAGLVAAGLIERDVAPGERVAIMLPTSIEFFAAFFGILYAGAIPVPIYPPMQLSQIEEYVRRQAGILRNAAACLLITPPEGLRLGSVLRGLVSDIARVESVASLSSGMTARRIAIMRDASATALIQYTSGSTGDPKGVVLSHENLLANIRAIGRAINASSADVLVSWLPLYHDMGLIGAWLGSLYFGAPFYVMSPLSFLARPQSWLWAMHRFRATISAAPNFAFERCVDKIDDADLAGLDLSSLRYLANGAEPVSVQTLQRFCEKFGRYGFRRDAMASVYGLAENAVSLTLPPAGRGPVIDRVNRQALTRDGRAETARANDPNAVDVVACGQPIVDHEVRIIDDLGRELGERREGRLEFRGASATSGYFRNEAKTRELFHDGWLDSGDRAYMAGGDVFITGRTKDIIIRAGQHIYPQEIEDAVGAISGFRKGGVAVFGLEDRTFRTERVVVLAECRGNRRGITQQFAKAGPRFRNRHYWCAGGRNYSGANRDGTEDFERQGPARRRSLALPRGTACCRPPTAPLADHAVVDRELGAAVAAFPAIVGRNLLCRLVVACDRLRLRIRRIRRHGTALAEMALGGRSRDGTLRAGGSRHAARRRESSGSRARAPC